MKEKQMLAPIPNRALPNIDHVPIRPADEPLVCISDAYGDVMEFQPMYYAQGIRGAIRQVYVRKTVADMLLEATRLLPEGYRFKILDAWRPADVQKALYEAYYCRLSADVKNAGKSEEELKKMAVQFVSYPSENPDTPFVHATGGAVDLTVVDSRGNELDMGTAFDDFSAMAHTAYFEEADDPQVRDNRRLLYHTMRAVGFTNYPAEWWHYDFGDRFWAAEENKDSIYQGIYTAPKD